MLSQTTTVNGQQAAAVAYGYDNLGKPVSQGYGNGVQETVTYNVQGWMRSKAATKAGANIFNMTLRYHDPLHAAARYGGEIAEMQWQHGAGTGNAYAFAYDNLGRLTSSTRHAGGVQLLSYTERDLAYDRNGNITALKRYGSNGGVPQDNFSYSYNGNSLASITGSISAAYSHDQNGNMTFDGRKNLQISYNLLSLPQTVNQAGMQVANYYNTTDHLASIRVITDQAGTVAEQNDYYPFGKRTNTGEQYLLMPANRYKFNGKELQTIANMEYLDYGARLYDPTIARWLTRDPLADDYYSLSPYGYCAGNPIKYIDVNGEFIGTIIGAVVGGVTGAYDSYKKGGDVWAGAAEGAVSGAIARATIDLAVAATVATGGGTLGGALSKGLQAASNSTKALQGTMSKNINETAKTLTKMGADEKTIETAINKISTGMSEAGVNTINTTNTVAAGTSIVTESVIKAGQKNKEKK
jgi:RHS repeat-associated protein